MAAEVSEEDPGMSQDMTTLINPMDFDQLKESYRNARPFPFVCVDNFLQQDFARQVVAQYPSFEEAGRLGRKFDAVNERLKVQITNADVFPPAVRALSDLLASSWWLTKLESITGVQSLLSDASLSGGGIHVTGSGGRLDVHVDFNVFGEQRWHRRLNLLLYLNQDWSPEWGGNLELWNDSVSKCWHSFSPLFNRLVLFETSEISFHGVTPVTGPMEVLRKSFAAYYYTDTAPADWNGRSHSTIFRARPDERFRRWVSMPLERQINRAKTFKNKLGRRLRGVQDPQNL
jgi:Rps23 Pro-64 3,4-dihydroxylase Tpa1-like proline 4-hydroxylase